MPIRRYLRVSQYTVIETRIHLENPALLATWLLHPRDPVLPKVIETIRGVVLKKLREEADATKMRGQRSKKKAAEKDVVRGDGFEVSVFLTDTITPHFVLAKTRLFLDPKRHIKSNSSLLTRAADSTDPSGTFGPGSAESDPYTQLRSAPGIDEWEAEGSLISGGQEAIILEDEDGSEEEKPLYRTTFDGFSIYPNLLCLLVKKLDATNSKVGTGLAAGDAGVSVPLPTLGTFVEQPQTSGSRGMMEEWITLTQISKEDHYT